MGFPLSFAVCLARGWCRALTFPFLLACFVFLLAALGVMWVVGIVVLEPFFGVRSDGSLRRVNSTIVMAIEGWWDIGWPGPAGRWLLGMTRALLLAPVCLAALLAWTVLLGLTVGINAVIVYPASRLSGSRTSLALCREDIRADFDSWRESLMPLWRYWLGLESPHDRRYRENRARIRQADIEAFRDALRDASSFAVSGDMAARLPEGREVDPAVLRTCGPPAVLFDREGGLMSDDLKPDLDLARARNRAKLLEEARMNRCHDLEGLRVRDFRILRGQIGSKWTEGGTGILWADLSYLGVDDEIRRERELELEADGFQVEWDAGRGLLHVSWSHLVDRESIVPDLLADLADETAPEAMAEAG